jgi:phosphate transport system permease protein
LNVQQAIIIPASGRARRGFGDAVFATTARASGGLVLLLLGGIILSLFIGGIAAFREFGPGFVFSTEWDPVHQKFGALVSIYGTLITSAIALVLAVPVAFGVAFFLTELIMSSTIQPAIINFFDGIPVLQDLFAGPPFGTGIFTAALILAVMVIPFVAATMRDVFDTVPAVYKESAYGVGCTTWEVMRSIVLPYTRVSVVGGIMLGLGRALGETMAVTFVIGNADRISETVFGSGNTIASIVALEFPESPQGSLKLASLLALGFILFVISFIVLAISRMLLKPKATGG